MSKAFTKEPEGEPNDDIPDEDELDDKPRGPRYITQAGFDKLRAERDHLWHKERPLVTAEVQAAAAQGDRSENAEYIYGKKRLREIDRRIRFLTKRLDILTVVSPSKEQEGRVFFGAWVTIVDEDDQSFSYRIVGSDEIDLPKRCISVESPVAKALLGKRVGDTASVIRPKGLVEVTVLQIKYDDPT
jgi:transcription elongation factor GreB